jgi:dihydroorotase (multifunctional complex type)
MTVERVIVNGRVLQNGDVQPLDIALADGHIVALGARGAFNTAGDTIDAAGKLVFPGAIDSHFHARAPSHPERETFASATAAAAASGVTTIIEMPISEPPAINGAVVRSRARLAGEEAYVNVGFYASCATLRRDDLVSSIEAGALAFKAFLQHVPPGRESEFEGLCLPTNGDLLRAFELLQDFDLPCAFHAEDEAMLRALEARLRAAGRHDGLAHAEHRPDYVEAVSVGTLLRLADRFGVHLHVPHVSSHMTADLIRDAKARGVKVTAETCPQYLQFDASALEQLGPYATCNPPFKRPDDVAGLWDALRDGTIDTIASDHSPFTAAEKDQARDDIWLAPPGFPGVEVLLPYVIGAALEGRVTFMRANELLFVNPARIFGLWPRKGVIQPGADADLLIYDPNASGVFDHHTFRSKAKDSGVIWDGVPRRGAVTMTLLRGDVVFDGRDVIGRSGAGRVVARG